MIRRGYRSLLRILAVIAIAVLAAMSGVAQRGDIEVRVATAQHPNPLVISRVVRANTVMVQVRDDLHQQIPGLQAGNFAIRRRGQLADIIKCTPKTETKELSQRIVLMIDNSASMTPHIDRLLMDLDTLLATFGRNTSVGFVVFRKDESSMITYKGSGLPLHARWFTTNKGLLARQLRGELESSSLVPSTNLYDEIWAGYTMLEGSRVARRGDIGIVLSDGEDNASDVTLEDLTALTWGTTPLYAIDYMNQSASGRLGEIATKTKGKYFRTNDIGELKKIFSTITSTMALGGYEIEYRLRDLARANHMRFSDPMAISEGSSAETTVDTLIVEELTVRQQFPLLAYLFFEPGSAEIPARYQRLSGREEIGFFDETRLSGDALAHYYQLLNIIGARMIRQPQASISITGCSDNDQFDSAVPDIGRKRAEAVQRYLTEVWGIEPLRLNVRGRGLPDVPSTTSLEEGKAENRRVEIESLDWEIIRPVSFEAREVTAKPTETVFKMEVSADDGLKQWTLPLYAGSSLFHELKGTSSGFVDLHWNWRNAAGELPQYQLRYEVVVEDSLARTKTIEGSTIPVKVLTEDRKLLEQLPEKDVERISLILFEFGRADLGPQNERILRDVPSHVTPQSAVMIVGYTDIIGEDATNYALSVRRSSSVRDRLTPMLKTGKPIRASGLGEQVPFFSNAIPEGRFYNRTVQIIIETPRATP